MKRPLQTVAVPAAVAASFLLGCSTERITSRTDPNRSSVVQVREGYDTWGRRWGEPNVLSRNNSMLLTFTGTITDIDYSSREVTLQGPQGRIETFAVGPSVQRLDEAKVGDKVSVDYYLGFNAQVRKPTAQEAQNPLVVVESAGRAGMESNPAAGGVRQIRAVVTIESLDRAAETVTVKGPRGKYFTARVADPSRLDKVRIGDTIVLTFTEAAAVSLKPAAN